ncbi:MAG: type II secretion system protein GspD [Chitinispirillaceae bacterium]
MKYVLMIFFLVMSATTVQSQPTAADSSSVVEQRMSLDVKDTDLRDVIRMISKGYDLNILLDQDVQGTVTLHLSDVPIIEGLRQIAESNGLEVIKDGSVYKIQKAPLRAESMIRYINNKLTVDVQNTDIKSFLKELSTKTAISIVPDTKLEGKLTGKLYQVNFDDGIRALLEANGFDVVKRRNIYRVSSDTPQGSNTPPSRMKRRSRDDFYVDYTNGLITLSVSNGDLEEIIKAIAEQGDVEIITYGSIKSEVNAKINNAPLTEALALLLGGTRFTFVQRENVILIGDRNTATPSGQALSKSELIHLRHIKADNIPSILPKDIPPTNVRVIKEQNALLISGTSEDIVAAREFLNTIDIPTPQVKIDAVIVEYKENLDKEMGLKYGNDKNLTGKSYARMPSPETHVSKGSDKTEIGISGKYLKELLKKYLPKGGQTLTDHIDEDFFLALKLLENQNRAKVLAQPSILTLNGNKASIDVSETQYYKVTTGTDENYTIRFQPIKFGIQLDITPWISQSGQITAEITPVVSNSEKTNDEGYPNVSSRSLTTTVRLNDGETLILGGLIKNQETDYKYKVPILGDIPIIGALFRHSGKTRSKSNLAVYITPRIISQHHKVNLNEELENFNLQQKNFFERQMYKGMKNTSPDLKDSSEQTAEELQKKEKEQKKKSPKDSSSPVVETSLEPEQPKENNANEKAVEENDTEQSGQN